jgi:hypothetical protein
MGTHSRNARTTVVLVDRSGHRRHADAPRESLAAIAGFLATADSRG